MVHQQLLKLSTPIKYHTIIVDSLTIEEATTNPNELFNFHDD